MKTALVYVYPDLKPHVYEPLARRFVNTYMEYPPGEADHELYVVVNSRSHSDEFYKEIFSPLPCHLSYHNNVGKDIGAFQMMSASLACDILVCLGAPVHFCRAGWLDQIVNAYLRNGPALYGPWGFSEPKPHIRTTAFWLPPEILNSYPHVVNDGTRYEFEHGDRSIHAHCKSSGLESFMVTWNGCYPQSQWHHVGLDATLFLDQHSHHIK